MNDELDKAYATALQDMSTPRSLRHMVQAVLEVDELGQGFDERAILSRVQAGDSALLDRWARKLAAWDIEESPEWADGTAKCTSGRREAVYARLKIGEDLRSALDAAVPLYAQDDGTLIAVTDFTPWYTDDHANGRFYWPRYKQYLDDKGFDERAIADLNNSTRMVVERLADPEQAEPRQTKGLVVGHVQSGKTANFTGVIARGIDAGYRLVIVLSGTLNLLRGQTQRRLDKELIGQENILLDRDPEIFEDCIGVDYVLDDHEWRRFIKFGDRPERLGAFNIARLTTREKDYQSLQGGIQALQYDKREKRAPLYEPVNLHSSAARIAIVKKNSTVLKRLVTDLKQVKSLLADLPVLIIDDESDQASVNTSNPKKWKEDQKDRTAINGHIAQLLRMMPRAQYIGYTATPFANVFIDPEDSEDVFPGDYVLSLPTPSGYMGAAQFYDLHDSAVDNERTYADSNEKAYIRDIWGDHDDRLQEAIDAFLITGALKLYRARHGFPEDRFRHHTMLVHDSVRVVEHEALARRIEAMWHESAPLTRQGMARLEDLYLRDFAEVSAVRAAELPLPSDFADLRECIGEARRRITEDRPVRVVNGSKDKDYEDVDFDRSEHVWKIIVGGTKLSRGFTVEGLTISYYRRTTSQADTLMQMGRWFGYRPGYADLVRLYIGRDEVRGRDSVDLHEAFKAACLDEEDFREQLRRFGYLIDGRPQVTPAEVPPLVRQQLPWLKPTASNKMYNAELVSMSAPGKAVEFKMYPTDSASRAANIELWAPVLELIGAEPVEIKTPSGRTATMKTGVIEHRMLTDLLERLAWEDGGKQVAPHLRDLKEHGGPDGPIQDWMVLFPQLNRSVSGGFEIGSYGLFSLSVRSGLGKLGVRGSVATQNDRVIAEDLVRNARDGVNFDGSLKIGPRRGVMIAYPMVAEKPSERLLLSGTGAVDPAKLVIGLAVVPPIGVNSGRPEVRFRTRHAGGSAIVDAPGDD
ncbi:Z1 domain-containing protein [Glycomyces sp. NPDC048151]|uniref:Z1 domain-containing protein n=1 Tax=Glycomyces sp. NPDC048151 TaxID=3364002 RepID=UPI0037187004